LNQRFLDGFRFVASFRPGSCVSRFRSTRIAIFRYLLFALTKALHNWSDSCGHIAQRGQAPSQPGWPPLARYFSRCHHAYFNGDRRIATPHQNRAGCSAPVRHYSMRPQLSPRLGPYPSDIRTSAFARQLPLSPLVVLAVGEGSASAARNTPQSVRNISKIRAWGRHSPAPE